MSQIRMIFQNQIFYRKKSLPAVLLVTILLLVCTTSILTIARINDLADNPLKALSTELILEKKPTGQVPVAKKTRGIITPFNLLSFKTDSLQPLHGIKEIKGFAKALVLWEFKLNASRILVALDVNDEKYGLRAIEDMLINKSRFFSGNSAGEVILERHYAALFGFKLNKTMMLNGTHLKIVGIVDFKEQSNLSNASIFLPYQTGLRLADIHDTVVNQVYISLYRSFDQTTVSEKISRYYPDVSIINKDSLFKNLSGFNQMIYRSGKAFIAAVLFIIGLLILVVLKFYRNEFRFQVEIFRILGWPHRKVANWVALDLVVLCSYAVAGAVPLSLLVKFLLIDQIELAPLINLGFTL